MPPDACCCNWIFLRPVYHGENGLRTLRELARSYQTISKGLTRVMNRLKALYRGWGIPCAGSKLFRSNSMPCRTHVDLDLQRWDCREVSHAHQVVGCAGEGEDPVHFAHSAMPHFAQQG